MPTSFRSPPTTGSRRTPRFFEQRPLLSGRRLACGNLPQLTILCAFFFLLHAQPLGDTFGVAECGRYSERYGLPLRIGRRFVVLPAEQRKSATVRILDHSMHHPDIPLSAVRESGEAIHIPLGAGFRRFFAVLFAICGRLGDIHLDLSALAFRVRNGRNHSRSCDEQTENIGGLHGQLGPEPDG